MTTPHRNAAIANLLHPTAGIYPTAQGNQTIGNPPRRDLPLLQLRAQRDLRRLLPDGSDPHAQRQRLDAVTAQELPRLGREPDLQLDHAAQVRARTPVSQLLER